MSCYFDIDGNGFGCHLTGSIISLGYAKYHNLEFKHKPYPQLHHYANNIKMNELIPFNSLFNIPDESIDLKIDYQNIYFESKYLNNEAIEIVRGLLKNNNKKIYNYVIHIRRGDITLRNHPERYIDISKYNQLIKHIRYKSNDTIHILTDGDKSTLVGLEDDNLEIHYKEDIIDSFLIMVNAKNLFVGWSSFSYSAGLLNKNNVYNDILISNIVPYYHPSHSSWNGYGSCAIVGLCKNVESHLDSSMLSIFNMSKAFIKTYVYILTNNNTDNTISKLNEKKKEFNLDMNIDIYDIKDTDMNRKDLTLMVWGRNKCLEYAKKMNVSYMICLDLDDVAQNIKTESINNILGLEYPWGCVSRNYSNLYDRFSLRMDSEPFNKCIHKCNKIEQEIYWSYNPPNKGFYKMNCYFGGCCIYRIKALENIEYRIKDKNGFDCCEHIGLQEQMIDDLFLYCEWV